MDVLNNNLINKLNESLDYKLKRLNEKELLELKRELYLELISYLDIHNNKLLSSKLKKLMIF